MAGPERGTGVPRIFLHMNYNIDASPFYMLFNKSLKQLHFSDAFIECLHKRRIFTGARITELTKEELFALEDWQPEFWEEIKQNMYASEFWPDDV